MTHEEFAYPADSILESALNHVARLTARPPSVPVLLHSDHFDFLLQCQHWFAKGYYMADDSLIERDSDGSCCGVVLHRPMVSA